MAGKPGVFSSDSMRRISRAVQSYEGGSRDMPVVRLPRMGDDDGGPKIRLGKNTSLWPVNQPAVAIPIWDAGTVQTPLVSTTAEMLDACNLLRIIPAGTFVYLAEVEIDGEAVWQVVAAADTPPLTKLGKVGQQWTTGGAAISIPIWDAGTIATPLVSTTAETVMAGNTLFTIKSGSWVFLAQVIVAGDLLWHVIAASDTYNAATIGGADLSIHTSYNGALSQALGHDGNGALKWFTCNFYNGAGNIFYFGCS